MARRVGDAHAETRDKLDATVTALLRIRSIVETDVDWPADDIIAEVNGALEIVRPGSGGRLMTSVEYVEKSRLDEADARLKIAREALVCISGMNRSRDQLREMASAALKLMDHPDAG